MPEKKKEGVERLAVVQSDGSVGYIKASHYNPASHTLAEKPKSKKKGDTEKKDE